MQMRYGSIGWSVGAVLGYAAASRATAPTSTVRLHQDGLEDDSSTVLPLPDTSPESKRVVAFIGDGSFQVCACEGHSVLV
jgi:TPP-dependent 2-oxoacid decarboxylase